MKEKGGECLEHKIHRTAHKGLWGGKPTIINNVETLANIPAIFKWSKNGLKTSEQKILQGTKVFALGGKIEIQALLKSLWELH